MIKKVKIPYSQTQSSFQKVSKSNLKLSNSRLQSSQSTKSQNTRLLKPNISRILSKIQILSKELKQRPLSQKVHERTELIANNLVQKSRHKYLYKKALNNNKFQWLNKYLQKDQLLTNSFIKNNMIKQTKNLKQIQKSITLKETLNSNKSIKSNYQYKNNLSNKIKTENYHEEFQEFQSSQQTNFKHHFIDFSETQGMLKQISTNSQLLNDNSSKIKKSHSSKSKGSSNVLVLYREQYGLKQVLIQQQLKNKHAKSRILTQKSNLPQNVVKKQYKNTQNSPSLTNFNNKFNSYNKSNNSHNMSNNSYNMSNDCLKNKKKQYLLKSRQDQRLKSDFFRRKRQFQDDIKVEPWNIQIDDIENLQF